MKPTGLKYMWIVSVVLYVLIIVCVIVGMYVFHMPDSLVLTLMVLGVLPFLCAYNELSLLRHHRLEQQMQERTDELQKAF